MTTPNAITYEVDPASRAGVQRGLDEFAKAAAEATAPSQAVLAIGVAAAKDAAPRLSGELIGSIGVDAGAAGGQFTVGVSYAPYQEFGTRYVAAKRFAKAGYDAMEAGAAPAFDEHLASAIAKVGG